MVSSAVYPDLERKPGGPDNWVEAAGGLPKYIERIAKHLHYEKGMSISHAIATAVNTVKRWARGGKVAKYGDPNHKNVSAKTIAQAAAAVASWEAKKKAGSLALADDLLMVIDLTEPGDWAYDLLEWVEADTTGADRGGHAILSAMNIKDLAERANQVEDPEARAQARLAVLDLAVPGGHLTPEQATEIAVCSGLVSILDLASTIPPRNARGRVPSDGRKSFKGQGKWKHGFIPVSGAAAESKSKGSPIAMKRMKRLFGEPKKDAKGAPNQVPKRSRAVTPRQPHLAAKGRAGDRHSEGRKRDPKTIKVDEKLHPGSESAKDIGQLRRTPFAGDQNRNKTKAGSQGTLPDSQKEASKATRIPERARQNWNEIPEALRTVRNGKRYVLAEFGGKQYVTEWLGGVKRTESTPLAQRKVMRTLASADAANMSAADLRALMNNPRTPASVKKVARAALKLKAEVEA